MDLNQNIHETPAAEQEEMLNIKDLIAMCLARWYWFVISLIVCLGLGVIYILTTPPTFSRTAKVLVKEDANGRKTTNDLSGLEDFDLFKSKSNIFNEIGLLSSPDMMRTVVERLNLNIMYSTKGKFHREQLYGKSNPIRLSIPEFPADDVASFNVNLDKNGNLVLSKFTLNKDKFDDEIKCKINTPVKTPIGELTISSTSQFKEYKGNDDIKIYINRIDNTINFFEKELSVNQDQDKSSIIQLTVKDVSPERAVDILNALINAYNENWVDDRNMIAIATSNFISERLAVIENELGNVDSDISSYKSANLLPDVAAVSQMYMKQADAANNAILDLNNKIYMAHYVSDYLKNQGNNFQPLPVNSGFENAAIAKQIDDYNENVIQRNALVANSSTSNPIVKDMDAAIAAMRSSILSSIDNQIVTLTAQIKSQQKFEGQAISKIASNPKQANYLLSVERQQKVKESLYLYLLQKREENELSKAFIAYNSRVVMKPQGSRFPIAPVTRNILLIAFVLGIAIPVGLIYLRETLNSKIRGRKDIEKLTMPYIGEIPYTGKRKKKFLFFGEKKHEDVDGAIVVKKHSRNVINEAFRVIRTNLEFMLGNTENGTIISITSANPGSGKTFISFNLAAALALKDKKILAIDLDLRKGSLSKYANSPKIGITDYLVGKVDDYHKVIIRNLNDTGLDMMPMGTMPPNPTELLFVPRLKELLDSLRNEYDIIFLDCPPVEIVADASIINKLSDQTIFIVRAGLLERAMLPEIERYYRDGRYRNLTLLLNGTDCGKGRYGYRYGYHYGYGNYGSAYGSTEKD